MKIWRLSAAVGIAVVLALAPAVTASAAGQLELSNDGVTFGTTLAAPVFSPSPVLVPLQSASSTFWVRNASTVAAYLRLTLVDSSWSSWDYGSGLTLNAAVPGKTGASVPLASTPACSVILYGVLLAPGASVQVTATMALGDKNGSSGQTGWAAVDFGVTLIEAAGLTAASDCSAPVTPVVVVPPPPAGGTTAPTTDAEVVVPGDGDSEPNAVPFPDPDNVLEVLTNTLASFNTDMLSVASASVPLGAGLFLLVGFGRRARDKFREVDES